MRLLSGANLAKEEEDESEAAIREWSGLTAGAELDSILKGLRSPETRQETAPPDLKAELRPYQQTGYAWLRFVARLGLGACLADDMGLGKTVQVISLLLDLKRDKQKNASLLVVPASLIANWKSELAKFAPSLSFAVVHPSEVNANAGEIGLADADSFDLIVTTYGMLVRTDWMKRHRWRLAILDEAQAIKNSGTKQTRAVKELTAGSRIAMTGTPVENRLSDLWSLFDFLNPGLLGTAKQFGSFVKRLQDAPVPSFEPLRNLVRPYILRRLKTDKRVISDLPDKTEVKAYCALSKHQAALYQKAVDDLAEQLEASRRNPAAGHRSGPTDAAEADLQSSRPGGRHERLRGRPERQVSPAGGDRRGDRVPAGEGPRFHAVPRDRRTAGRVPRHALRSIRVGAPRGDERQEAEGVRRPISTGRRPALLRAVAESGRDRAEPDGGFARDPLRPLVEPGHREPGHRPRLPDRPEEERARSQVHLPGNGRGADRRDDRAEDARSRTKRSAEKTPEKSC